MSKPIKFGQHRIELPEDRVFDVTISDAAEKFVEEKHLDYIATWLCEQSKAQSEADQRLGLLCEYHGELRLMSGGNKLPDNFAGHIQRTGKWRWKIHVVTLAESAAILKRVALESK